MKIQLTEKVISRMILKAKRIFMASSQPDEYKEILRNIEPHIMFNDRLKTTYGTAFPVRYQTKYRVTKGMKRSHRRYQIDGRRQHLVIELNKDLNQKCPSSVVYDTVSHELAHCLDFCIRGFDNDKRGGFHDRFWKDLHRAMGGTGIGLAYE